MKKKCDHIWRVYMEGDKVKTCVKCWKEIKIKSNKKLSTAMYLTGVLGNDKVNLLTNIKGRKHK